jgi:hypothetical protein
MATGVTRLIADDLTSDPTSREYGRDEMLVDRPCALFRAPDTTGSPVR